MATEPQCPIGYCEGFGISLNVTHPDHQIDIAVGACRCSDNCADIESDAPITVDIEDAGANGLDAGAEAGNTLYYVWIITDVDTPATAGLLSISDSAPTMPAGYTLKRLVGSVYNDAADDFETPTDEHFDIPNKLKAAEIELTTALGAGTPVANTLYKENIIKGRIQFSMVGAGAIADSFNVAAISDDGVGDWDVEWDTDFANTGYAYSGETYGGQNSHYMYPFTNYLRVLAYNSWGAAYDASRVTVTATGGQ